ncbi:PREDICTED: sulfotransferase 1C4-like, partial [Priapulus caudatus]|uniref:Sulfotransferase 1C4-like n=1 Tax=Priapulus caudatus TaxID=37621 RepID=A0ABM1F5M0_PRICU
YAAPKNTYLYKDDILNFRVRDDDVWVLTYPKCGTTWTQEMVWMICHDADSALARSATIMDRFPMLDTPDGAEISRLAARASPRYIKSHLPLCLLPRGLLHSKAKIIYTVRNPKDTSISLYKFFQMMEIRHMDSSFEDFMFYFTEQT